MRLGARLLAQLARDRRLFATLVLAGLVGLAAHPFKQLALLQRDEWPRYEEYVTLQELQPEFFNTRGLYRPKS